MHPRTAELTALLDRTRAELRDAAHDVPPDTSHRRLAATAWSPPVLYGLIGPFAAALVFGVSMPGTWEARYGLRRLGDAR